MKRRMRFAAFVVALMAVGWLLVGTQPSSTALAGDPLSDAKAKQQQLQNTLAQQRAQLAALKSTATRLSTALALAKSKLASVSAQYQQVSSIVAQVTDQVNEVRAQLKTLNDQIDELDAQLKQVADEIVVQTAQLAQREALLQDHLRTAYEQSQTSLLEVLLSANSLDDATNQVGYLPSLPDHDKSLAGEIRDLRAQLDIKQQELTEGRAALADSRKEALAQQKQLATLKAQWQAEKAKQEAALNASLSAQSSLNASISQVQAAASAQAALVKKLQAQQAAASLVGPGGFSWPESPTRITQYYGPTSFSLEPPYAGYAHFHTGLDMAAGCGAPIRAAANGVVASSGQPLYPYDYAYGVIINHGGGVQTWYWHMQPRVIVSAGQSVVRGQVIGYEGATGFATGCHLHFAVNVNGGWRNPLGYLP